MKQQYARVRFVFNLFLIDQPGVHDLVPFSVVFPEAGLSLTEFLLIVAQHSLVYNAQPYIAGMGISAIVL